MLRNGLELRQIGPGDELLRLTTDTGRVAIDGDQVGALLDYLARDPIYRGWMRDALGWVQQ